jgi:hypothetical protein
MQLTFDVGAETLACAFDDEPVELMAAMVALRQRLVERGQWDAWLESLAWEMRRATDDDAADLRAMVNIIQATAEAAGPDLGEVAE